MKNAEISDSGKDKSDEEILEKIHTKKNSDEEDSSEEDSSEEDSDEKKINFLYTHKYHQKLPDYRRNYYLTHKKIFLKILGQSGLFQG